MIDYIKNLMYQNTDYVIEFLEYFGFANIKKRQTYITCGRDIESSPKSIVFRLTDNKNLLIKDYPKNIVRDIFGYVVVEKNIDFKTVISVAKDILNIQGYVSLYAPKRKVFGGFYEKIKTSTDLSIRTYSEDILKEYSQIGNMRFYKDGISLSVQKMFNIGYSIQNQAITIPIYTETGELMGVKARINKDPDENEEKYYYLVSCLMSQTLYGYSHNYAYLESSDIVYVVESEKTVLAACSYGKRNFVALGSGSLSTKQTKLLLKLNANKIVFLHDTGYPLDSVMRNIDILNGYCRIRDVKIGYWNNFDLNYDEKLSPTDLGRDGFYNVLKNEIKYID